MPGQRALPDFLIIGAMKCATTSLHGYLCQHPGVLPASKKEVHYFDSNYAKGLDWYRTHFPLQTDLQAKGAITFEASPSYLFHPHCARRIHETLPRVRLVAVLRDPVERAFSHYRHMARSGREPRPFLEAASDLAPIEAEMRRMAADPDSGYSPFHIEKSYLARGHYREQIDAYLHYFPRAALHIVILDDLMRDGAAEMDRLCDFLALPRFRFDLSDRRNVSEPAAVAPGERAALRDHFAPHNAALYALLQRDLGW